jgi:hypothetical protein
MGDDFLLCNILFSPWQVIYGAAQKSIRWVKRPQGSRGSQKAAVQASEQREEEGKGQGEAS